MNLFAAITLVLAGDVSIRQLPTLPLSGGALVHTVGSGSIAGVRISNPQPMSRSINLWFPATQTDETAPGITYAIDWTQPNGSKVLPENLRWNAFNVGDLYWQPANSHAGLHQFTVTATSGTQSAATTFRINVLASTTPVPIPGPAGAIKAYFYSPGSNTAMAATTQTGASEPYLSWLVYPATHCCWYADISGSGGSYSAGDYGINYIGQTGGARSASWILTPGGQNQINALVNYCMLSRSNHYIAWPSQTPSFSSTLGFSRYVADTNAVVGAGEGRYQATYAFKDAFYRLFNGLSPDLRRRIVAAGHFIPTYQVALRRAQAAATGYMDDPKVHPTVFTSTATTTDLARVDAFVATLNDANVLLPICTVSVLSEDWKLPLEELHTVDRSIARTWYGYDKTTGMDRERRMRLDARQSFVTGGTVRKIHWQVLETGGGADSIEITPLNPMATVVEVLVRFPRGNQPIKVGVFAEADSAAPDAARYSAPAFLTFSPWSDLDESRGSDLDTNINGDGAYIRLTGYDGYSLYDKREYRVYDAAGRLAKRSSGGRAQLWRHHNSLANVGDHKEDVFSYDAAGVMIGFTRLYANSFSTFGFSYTADGVRITAKDASGKPTLAEFQKQIIGLPERAVARVAFDYPTGQRRTARIDHLVYTPDPAHATDRRYDVASVQYVNTFPLTGDIQLSRGTSPATIEGTARFSPGMIDGYRVGSTTPDFSTAYNGEFETLADALQIVSANIMKPPVIGITIIPADVPNLAIGSTIQLAAKVTGLPELPVSWTIYSSPVVPSIGAISISPTGLVTGLKAGTDYAVASVANGPQVIQAFCRVSVTGTTPPPPVVTTIVVSPATASIEAGKAVQLTATVKDQYGATMTGVAVAWSSSNLGVAAVSSAGSVTGLSAGPATITASASGKAGSAAITITPETRVLTKAEVQQLLGQGLQRTVIDVALQADGTYKVTLGP